MGVSVGGNPDSTDRVVRTGVDESAGCRTDSYARRFGDDGNGSGAGLKYGSDGDGG